jgi:transposase
VARSAGQVRQVAQHLYAFRPLAVPQRLGARGRHLPGQAVVADKAYDADHFAATIKAAGAEAVTPPRSNRLTPREVDRPLYRARNLVECFFTRLLFKNFGSSSDF